MQRHIRRSNIPILVSYHLDAAPARRRMCTIVKHVWCIKYSLVFSSVDDRSRFFKMSRRMTGKQSKTWESLIEGKDEEVADSDARPLAIFNFFGDRFYDSRVFLNKKIKKVSNLINKKKGGGPVGNLLVH